MAARNSAAIGVPPEDSAGSVDVLGRPSGAGVPPADSTEPHVGGGLRTADALTLPAVARISLVPRTGANVTVVVALPFESVIVGVGEMTSEADGEVTNAQATDCPTTGAPAASRTVAVMVNGSHVGVPLTVIDPSVWYVYPKAVAVAVARRATAARVANNRVRRFIVRSPLAADFRPTAGCRSSLGSHRSGRATPCRHVRPDHRTSPCDDVEYLWAWARMLSVHRGTEHTRSVPGA